MGISIDLFSSEKKDPIKQIVGNAPKDLDTLEEISHELSIMSNKIKDVTNNNNEILKQIDDIKDGDVIVGQTREIHSRNGKTVTDSFLVRTTAGSGTIGDGVATLKSVGGNIVKNLIGENFKADGRLTVVKKGNVFNVTVNNSFSATISSLLFDSLPINPEHKFYFRCFVNSDYRAVIFVNAGYGTNPVATASTQSGWRVISGIVANPTIKDDYYKNVVSLFLLDYSGTLEIGRNASFASPLLIDLTEMFGAGNEPDQATCDRLFGTMDALPQGLTIANPTAFKSVGYNQFNPENVLKGKTINENGAIVDNPATDIAVVPCLPCKVGVGENNGYCVHGEFEDSDIKVYLTPLNPMDVEGELYMHELTPDATKGTYVPLIKGYMLIVIPSTHNGLPVTSIGDSAFRNCSKLRPTTLPQSIIKLGDYAFYGTMILGDSYGNQYEGNSRLVYRGNNGFDKIAATKKISTTVRFIAEGAFTNLTGSYNDLSDITLPSGLLSIGRYAFQNCKFETLNIPNNVYSIGYGAFRDCESLTSITIPSSVTSIGNAAFDECSSIKDLRIEDGETALSLGYNYYNNLLL